MTSELGFQSTPLYTEETILIASLLCFYFYARIEFYQIDLLLLFGRLHGFLIYSVNVVNFITVFLKEFLKSIS